MAKTNAQLDQDEDDPRANAWLRRWMHYLIGRAVLVHF